MLFHIDRKNLEVTTGGFPPAGFRSDGEHIELTESAVTLELLFSFVYPSRHAPLLDMDFQLFAEFAEAAEKYEVFCAIHTANAKMRCVMASTIVVVDLTKCFREAIQDHPIEVMNYASRHGYPELLDAAAPLTLDIPFDKIADSMSILIMPAWVGPIHSNLPHPLQHIAQLRYYHMWSQVAEGPKFTGHWASLTEFCPSYQEAIRRLVVSDWVRQRVEKLTTSRLGQLSQCSQWCGINAMRYQIELQNSISAIPPFTKLNKSQSTV